MGRSLGVKYGESTAYTTPSTKNLNCVWFEGGVGGVLEMCLGRFGGGNYARLGECFGMGKKLNNEQKIIENLLSPIEIHMFKS